MRLLILLILQADMVRNTLANWDVSLTHGRHGPITDCPISVTQAFVLEYMSLPENSQERIMMERRYGVKNVRRLVQRYEEEQANKQWLEKSTMECPTCHVHVEKSFGCNHVSVAHYRFEVAPLTGCR